MKPLLTIMTPVMRSRNLHAIAESLVPGRLLFDLRWWVIIDTTLPSYCIPGAGSLPEGTTVSLCDTPSDGPRTGEFVQNSVLPDFLDLPETWVWGLADDNLATKEFFVSLRETIDRDPTLDLIVFPMRHRDGLLEASSAKCHGGSIDGGQLVYRSSLIGSLRFGKGPCPDGDFAARLLERSKHPTFLLTPVLPYNALRG